MAALTPDDEGYLNAQYPGRWEPISEGGKNGLLIRGYRLPHGYAPETADLMVLIPPGYPAANLDMFYLSPPVRRKDGGVIAALSGEAHYGREWQRWSRHYEWRPGVDCIATHLQRTENILRADAR